MHSHLDRMPQSRRRKRTQSSKCKVPKVLECINLDSQARNSRKLAVASQRKTLDRMAVHETKEMKCLQNAHRCTEEVLHRKQWDRSAVEPLGIITTSIYI